MAIVYDPITQRQVQVADPPLPSPPPPAVEHTFLPTTPPPALPPVPPEAIVTAPPPIETTQAASTATANYSQPAPTPAAPVEPTLGSNVDSVV